MYIMFQNRNKRNFHTAFDRFIARRKSNNKIRDVVPIKKELIPQSYAKEWLKLHNKFLYSIDDMHVA